MLENFDQPLRWRKVDPAFATAVVDYYRPILMIDVREILGQYRLDEKVLRRRYGNNTLTDLRSGLEDAGMTFEWVRPPEWCACKAAGVFLTLRALYRDVGIDPGSVSPSTRLADVDPSELVGVLTYVRAKLLAAMPECRVHFSKTVFRRGCATTICLGVGAAMTSAVSTGVAMALLVIGVMCFVV